MNIDKNIINYAYNKISNKISPSRILDIDVTKSWNLLSYDKELEESIRHDYYIRYIKSTQLNDKTPHVFQYVSESMKIDISVLRDSKIDFILNSKCPEFDVESIIYSDKEMGILNMLRGKNGLVCLSKIKKEYSETFSIGDKVWYKEQPGVITFKHVDIGWVAKIKDNNEPTRWTVVSNGIETRYVFGTKLVKREVEKLENIEIDEKLNKLSTERLLKMYRSSLKVNKGNGDIKIKAILNKRENIK